MGCVTATIASLLWLAVSLWLDPALVSTVWLWTEPYDPSDHLG